MPRKSAHARLDQLRQAAAHERIRMRDLEGELQASNRRVEEANAAVAAGYASGDERAIKAASKTRDGQLAARDSGPSR